jgi:hypothetical protein
MKCFYKNSIKKTDKKCLCCGKTYSQYKYRKYCSYKCFHSSRIEEQVRRSKQHTKCKKCGKIIIRGLEGEWSWSRKKYCSISCSTKSQPILTGKNSRNWKGGITPINFKIRNSIQYKLWRDAVYASDGYTCQKTGIKGGKLQAHHILNFGEHPKLRFAIDNGITLSRKEHHLFHHIYGKTHNTKSQIEQFIGHKF